jgi:hypothetical protein
MKPLTLNERMRIIRSEKEKLLARIADQTSKSYATHGDCLRAIIDREKFLVSELEAKNAEN